MENKKTIDCIIEKENLCLKRGDMKGSMYYMKLLWKAVDYKAIWFIE